MSYLWEAVFGGSKESENGGIMADPVTFTVNDEAYTIDPTTTELNADYRLLDFIRNKAALTGTKYMCREGGCGACVVTATVKDAESGNEETRAVHSCIVPALSCHGWKVQTVESLGNRKVGYDPIQQKLVHFSGSQCGWCSSGMVMNMYSLMKSKPELTSQEIEDSFDGNICRCTGYRPILDAFKSFAVDASDEIKAKCVDIEDICVACPLKKNFSSKAECRSQCTHHDVQKSIEPSIGFAKLRLPTGEEWVKATNLANAFSELTRFVAEGKKYRVVAGNSGAGVFKYDGPYAAYLDVNDVVELKTATVEATKITVGAGRTLSWFINFLDETAKTAGFEYAAGMAKHIRRVANTPVRNLGTIAGNLMMKHAHNEFPSDIFLLLETVGAKINVACNNSTIEPHSPQEFLAVQMEGNILLSIELPQLTGYTFRSFKITKRHQNAHAYVNAGFLFNIDATANHKVVGKPTIVYGGIDPKFFHATKTEEFLTDKELGNVQTLKDAVNVLKGEVNPDFVPPDATPAYRKNLTQSLLYKFVLGVLETQVSSPVKSGGEDLPRNLTKGKQEFDADTGDSPLYKPVAKLEAPAQVSGEAEYINDIPEVPGELHGAFVLSTQGNATLGSIDVTEAMAIPGVVQFIEAKDIPGDNNNMGFAGAGDPEPIFVTDKISFAGQAIGMIIAKDAETAKKAAKLVKVGYTNVQPPILSIDQAVSKAKAEGTYDKIFGTPYKTKDAPKKAANNISGKFTIGSQAHVQMETHNAICRPNERGMDVYAATQWMDLTQATIAAALKVPNNTINVRVRRLGGAYGCKITRATHTAVACAIASHVTNKPCRVVLDFETNMQMVGKRFPIQITYDVGFDDNGKIEALKVQAICDTGSFTNESTDGATLLWLQNCYSAHGWEITPGKVQTNTPPNTWTRAPGSVKGIATAEMIMEHIAQKLNKDPIEVRKANLIQPGDAIIVPNPYATFAGPNIVPELIQEMEKSAEYATRKAAVDKFNQENRWRKRGIAMCPMRYPQGYEGRYGAYVAIYHADGSVAVGHAGIEMGQGLNTKVAQVVAHALGVTLDKIEIKPSDNLIGANSDTTGGALTSELVSFAALTAAQALKARIDAVKAEKKMEKATWEELIAACHEANVDLRETHMFTRKDPPKPYDIWGLNCVEAEIDCLTGEFKIIRSDILQDAGKSMSPEVDIGQIEGAYIMGLGLWTKERLVYDETTGQLLTKNTWEYKVPFPKCIPEDFRVKLLSNRPNPLGVLGSKATGEAPICLTVTNALALRNAIAAARKDAGNNEWFEFDSPITPERVVALSLTDSAQFAF